MYELQRKAPIAIMLFLQYTTWGAWYVTLSTYLGQTMGFSGSQIGLIYGAFALAAIVSPLIAGVFADFFFPAQKVFGTLHLIGAFVLFWVTRSEQYEVIYLLILIYAICYMPTIALSNSIAMSHLSNASTDFPKLRVMGTIGWIIIGWLVSSLQLEATHYPMLIAVGLSLLMVINCVFLPNTPPPQRHQPYHFGKLLGLDAFKLLRDRSFFILIVSSTLISIPLAFYFGFTNLFLNDIGVEYAAGKMTLGQFSEIFFMLLLPLFFKRFGIKYLILIAMLAWAIRYLCFALAGPDTLFLLLTGILLHGICYDFFFVAGQIYVNKSAPPQLRNSAQGLLTQMTYGVGMFIGTWFSGLIVEHYSTSSEYQWQQIWMIPAVLSFVVAGGFMLFFKPKPVAFS